LQGEKHLEKLDDIFILRAPVGSDFFVVGSLGILGDIRVALKSELLSDVLFVCPDRALAYAEITGYSPVALAFKKKLVHTTLLWGEVEILARRKQLDIVLDQHVLYRIIDKRVSGGNRANRLSYVVSPAAFVNISGRAGPYHLPQVVGIKVARKRYHLCFRI
jgi:hypothetical protein